MRKTGRFLSRILLICVLLSLFAGTAGADTPFPELNADGFLDEGEFVSYDSENGIWRYASETLRVEIQRFTSKKPKRIWYEAEIFSADGEIFRRRPSRESWFETVKSYRTEPARETDPSFQTWTQWQFSPMGI